jgi:hypothetical protein
LGTDNTTPPKPWRCRNFQKIETRHLLLQSARRAEIFRKVLKCLPLQEVKHQAPTSKRQPPSTKETPNPKHQQTERGLVFADRMNRIGEATDETRILTDSGKYRKGCDFFDETE